MSMTDQGSESSTDPWATMDTAPKDQMINLYCPGVSAPTKGVLQGQWDSKNSRWALNPYGTNQTPTLYPSRWCGIEAPPADVTPPKA